MSIFTRARNAVTGTVRDVADTVSNVAQTGIQLGVGALTNPLGTLGSLLGGPLPQQGQQAQMSSGFGPQTNLENLMNMTGQTQPTISQTSPTSGATGGQGLI